MVATADATSRALQEFAETHLVDEFAETHPLLFHVHARGSFHSRKKSIREIADLKGLKVRGPSRIVTDMLLVLGAVAGWHAGAAGSAISLARSYRCGDVALGR